MAEQRAQRRLAAILAADVVGYSRLMREDETGTLAQIKTLRKELLDPKVEEYGGRIVKTTGDGLLIEFPSAVDAVQHAVDVQQALAKRGSDVPESRRIELRMGINVGDVIVEGDDLFGDGVNIASRLEGLAEPGCTCISSSVYEQVRHKIDLAYDDMGEQLVKNIPDPVHVYRIAPSGREKADDGFTSAEASFRRPAVAVLPFENMSGDSDQEYFADGLTEDLITALSLFRSFPVIARHSTFAYKGQSPDIRIVGEELGARYVIEGSVRMSGSHVRVTCQLINAETGHHVWAERFDRELEDFFALQDEISQRIVGMIEPTIERVERKQVIAKSPNELTLWEYCIRGNTYLYEVTKEANEKARDMFTRAINLDPHFARAHIGLAYTFARELRFFMPPNQAECQKRLIDTARRAVSLDDTDSQAHTILSLGYAMTQQPDAAVAEAKQAVQLNPYDALANNVLGGVLSLSATRFEEGIPALERALLLSPTDPQSPLYLTQLALSHLCVGRYDKAVEYAREAILRRHDFLEGYLVLASGLGYLGRADEARSAFEGYSDLAERYLEQHVVFAPEVKDRLLDGWRQANLI